MFCCARGGGVVLSSVVGARSGGVWWYGCLNWGWACCVGHLFACVCVIIMRWLLVGCLAQVAVAEIEFSRSDQISRCLRLCFLKVDAQTQSLFYPTKRTTLLKAAHTLAPKQQQQQQLLSFFLSSFWHSEMASPSTHWHQH